MTTSLPKLISAIQQTINDNGDEIAQLDRAIGDGDHLINLQRGLKAVDDIKDQLTEMDWSAALMKIGMTLMSTMGGASGSLFASLFVTMAKAAKNTDFNMTNFAEIFSKGVESVKQRGKADIGEKTMLDTLIPVANSLKQDSADNIELSSLLSNAQNAAIQGMQSTKELIATKGRASFLGKRSIGHIDAGARTSQLIICAIADVLKQ